MRAYIKPSTTPLEMQRVRASLLLLICLCLGAVVTGETIRRTVAHRYQQIDPRVALTWEPSNVAARENLANQVLGRAFKTRSASERVVLIHTAALEGRRVLVEGPLHWAALRDVGFVADAERRPAAAAVIMARAGLRGRRDVATWSWFLQQDLRGARFDSAVVDLDALLRSEPDLEPRLLPVIAALLTQPTAASVWADHLFSGSSGGAQPPWRDAVLTDLALKSADKASIATLFAELRRRRSPVSNLQMSALLTRMVGDGDFQEAKRLWQAQLPPGTKIGTPYDGSFGNMPGAPPFNWRIFTLDSGEARIDRTVSSGSVLSASYPANQTPAIAEQLLVLAPGAYRLAGRWRVTQSATGAALVWTLSCAKTGASAGEWRHGVDAESGWTLFDAAFLVPPDCPAQWLRLSGRAGDGFGDVGVAFTQLSIAPAVR